MATESQIACTTKFFGMNLYSEYLVLDEAHEEGAYMSAVLSLFTVVGRLRWAEETTPTQPLMNLPVAYALQESSK